jgi:ESCRT-II complex subunit VPS25
MATDDKLVQGFEFPKIHSFPPLYTKQPNLTVLSNQLESWKDVILKYCEYYKITSLSLTGVPKYVQDPTVTPSKLPELFTNSEINRSVNDSFRKDIFDHLIKGKRGEYINPKNPQLGIFVYWRTLSEWADLIYEYVSDTGQLGTILTVYELTKNDDSGLPPDLFNLDEALLIKVIKDVLIKSGKAQILMNENNEIGGVKIV